MLQLGYRVNKPLQGAGAKTLRVLQGEGRMRYEHYGGDIAITIAWPDDLGRRTPKGRSLLCWRR